MSAHRLMQRATLLVLAASLLAYAHVAQAQSAHAAAPHAARGPALNWTRQPGAEGCIASIELASRIEARVGRPIFVRAPDAIVAVEGSVQPLDGAGFVATISVSDGKGTLYGSRELRTGGDCRQLDDALVLVIAVTLRPQDGYVGGIALPQDVALELDALFGAEPAEPDPAAFPTDPAKIEAARRSATAASAQTERTQTEPAAPRQREDSIALWLEARAFTQLGVTPALSGGGALGARVELPFGSLALRGALTLPSTRVILDGQRSEVRFSSAQVALEYCAPALLRLGALALHPCAAGRFGALEASGAGFSAANESRSEPWLAAGVVARAELRLSPRLALTLGVGPELFLLRPQYVYAASDGSSALVHRMPVVGALGELGLALRAF